MMNPHCTLCDLPIRRATAQQTLDELVLHTQQRKGAWLITLNTEMLSRLVREPDYRSILNQADFLTADGMPLVWASRLQGADKAISERTTGVDLVDAFLRLPHMPAYAIIGGVDPAGTVARYGSAAQDACRFLFNGAVDLSDAQVSEFVAALRREQVRMLFVALGVPKQDYLALKIRPLMPELVILGVGGSFEILGPNGVRAPEWMQSTGMEWLFRLSKEPKRLWRRYLVHYPTGVWLLARDSVNHLRTAD